MSPGEFLVFLALILTGSNNALPTSTVYGVGSPYAYTYDRPHYNWAANQCAISPEYWPMIWDHRGRHGWPGEACRDGRPLLILNEPEFGGQANTSPVQAAALVYEWRDWPGPIYCCGNFYGHDIDESDGFEWFLQFVIAYQKAHNAPPPITGIALHVYEFRQVDFLRLVEWKRIALDFGWDVVVTESGTFPSETYLPHEVAGRMGRFLTLTVAVLQPTHLFWFSDNLLPGALHDETQWENLNLYNRDGTFAPVGVEWVRLTQWNPGTRYRPGTPKLLLEYWHTQGKGSYNHR